MSYQSRIVCSWEGNQVLSSTIMPLNWHYGIMLRVWVSIPHHNAGDLWFLRLEVSSWVVIKLDHWICFSFDCKHFSCCSCVLRILLLRLWMGFLKTFWWNADLNQMLSLWSLNLFCTLKSESYRIIPARRSWLGIILCPYDSVWMHSIW